MRLEAFIIDLLYRHDCVVLPDFGGLVANYRTARLNRKSHVISPPSKHIGFNRNLKNNDGLLISHVAETLNISYKEATLKVDDCVAEFRRKLNEDGRFMLEKIGVFFKDNGGQLQFIPEEQENFLLSSFCLTDVQLKPVVHFENEKIEQPETPIVPIQDKRRISMGWKVAAAIAIPVLFAGTFLIGSSKLNEFSFSALNPFTHEVIVSPYRLSSDSWNPDMRISNQQPIRDAFANGAEEVEFDFLKGEIVERGIRVIKNKSAAVPVSTEVNKEVNPIRDRVKKSALNKSYALIGGAFQISENATNFLNKLKSEGFDASFSGKKDGMQLVAYGLYDSREEAQAALKNIKNAGGHAWIRHN